MSRMIFVLGIFSMSAALGVLGYQCLTYYFYGSWPPVSAGYVWGQVFGNIPAQGQGWVNYVLQWLAKVPVVALGLALAYVLLFCSDMLRGRNERPAR